MSSALFRGRSRPRCPEDRDACALHASSNKKGGARDKTPIDAECISASVVEEGIGQSQL